jgi:hypothetical protein
VKKEETERKKENVHARKVKKTVGWSEGVLETCAGVRRGKNESPEI